MCGINGVYKTSTAPVRDLQHRLQVMNKLIRHRGPDGQGTWQHPRQHVGFGHVRLSIIDLDNGSQPMQDERQNCLTYNGEVYNYLELREELGAGQFRTKSDTEVILRAYERWGTDCLDKLRGMFAFALWDEKQQSLFCARDRFGIKPFYYTVVGDEFYFASEPKALLPFMESVEADVDSMHDYLTFQFYLDGKTLFKGIHELPAGHFLTFRNGKVHVERYWEVYYNLDWDHTETYFRDAIEELMHDSIRMHMRADVPVGAYLSGGLDSSIVASMASTHSPDGFRAYTGKFTDRPGFDESMHAQAVADFCGFPLDQIEIQPQNFTDVMQKLVYHLDQPIAGPGSFPQFMVSQLAAQKHKVVLGGQGGDEIFGGYARYLIAYFEQCIRGALDGTIHNGNFIVTYESIIPNLTTLKQYKPMLKQFWSKGLFDPLDQRYFALVSRAPALGSEIRWENLETSYQPRDSFRSLFNSNNVQKESYFDQMTHFDFKTLLPALLHVEDRVSMAHGLESRVPFLDHPLIELAATIPSNIKFKDGTLKNLLRNTFRNVLPASVADRKDKMGFPVPLNDWMAGPAKEFVSDIFNSQTALDRTAIDNRQVLAKLQGSNNFDRTLWGLFSLELWNQQFVDKQADFRAMARPTTPQLRKAG